MEIAGERGRGYFGFCDSERPAPSSVRRLPSALSSKPAAIALACSFYLTSGAFILLCGRTHSYVSLQRDYCHLRPIYIPISANQLAGPGILELV